MVSRVTIKALVNQSEAKYQQCWDTLSRLVRPKDTEGVSLFADVLEFQPTLAGALYDLSEMHRTLHQEKQSVIAKKQRVSPKWFKHRMNLLAKYQAILKTTITIGKQLGDAFAWLFYSNERKHLREHYEQQVQFYLPPGIGGLGELKFIENTRLVEGHLVLYHGITTFLRLGDISFINLDGLRLAAVAEIKTTQVAEDQLSIMVNTVGQTEEAVRFLVDASVEQMNAHEPASLPLPQDMRAKLNRQIASIGESLQLPDSNQKMDVETDLHIDELQTLYRDLKTSSFTSKKIGDGLVVVGTRTTKRSLASKLMTPLGLDWNRRLGDQLTEEVQSIILPESVDNEIRLNYFNDPTSQYKLTPGMVPLFWWPLEPDVTRDILFYDVLLFSIYNPVHLVAKLRDVGFEVESLKGQRGLKVEKVLGDKILAIEGFNYFTRLVTEQFFDEQAVVEFLLSFSEKPEIRGTPPYARVEMQIQQHFGSKPT